MKPILYTVKHDRVFFVPLKSDLSSVRLYSSVHWTSHFLQVTRKTRSCLTGHSVVEEMGEI